MSWRSRWLLTDFNRLFEPQPLTVTSASLAPNASNNINKKNISVSGPTQKSANPFLWHVPTSMAFPLLSFVVSPLLGYLFSLNAFAAANKAMGLSGAKGTGQLLPLFLSYLEHQPISAVITKLLTKKLANSPFQR